MIEVKYFARFREELGAEGEQVDPAQIDSVGALLVQLRARGEVWSRLFAENQRVMMAVNQEVAERTTPLVDGDEVALFPPVTGG
jgi:molybdopterin synthase sulfur carrier subunit